MITIIFLKDIKIEPKIKPEFLEYNDNDQNKHVRELETFLEKLASANRGTTKDINENKIANQRWYFIKFQSFCKSDSNGDIKPNYRPYFVLAEVALIEYTLKDGILKEYHSFIKPNQIPLGYTSQCMERSKEVNFFSDLILKYNK